MTDEVQPLTWQKSTNLKEHQQFFSKINEIIDNLAPTVDEAEAAIAAANAAIANAQTAINMANTAINSASTAIATANAASSEATTAAETVAGYAARLSAIESAYIKNVSTTVQTIDSDLQIVNGHNLAVAGDVNAAGDVNGEGAELAGMAFEKNGSKTRLSNEDGVQIVGTTEMDVANTATGTRSLAAVNGNRVQNDLDGYATMVRTVNAQLIQGVKTFLSSPRLQNPIWAIESTTDTIAVIKAFDNAQTPRYVHFTAIRTAGGFEGRVMFSITTDDVVTQVAVSKMGTAEAPVCGLIQLSDGWYIYLSGAVAIKDVYIRRGNGRNVDTVVLDEPISIGETETRYQVVWS